MEDEMRYVAAVTILLAAMSFADRKAAALEYPWCAWYDWSTSNCGFSTLQQCLATISGIGGDCRRNPHYQGTGERRERRRDRR